MMRARYGAGASASKPGAPAWRILTMIAAAWMLLTLGGCGGNDVAMTVDVLSFVSESERSDDYLVPEGLRLPPTTIEPQMVTLGSGIAERVDMERVEIHYVVEFEGTPTSGLGFALVALYLAPSDTTSINPTIYQSAPTHDARVELAGTTRALAGTIEATAENGLLPVFQHGEFVLGLAITFDATNAEAPLTGRWTIRQIDALILGRGDPF